MDKCPRTKHNHESNLLKTTKLAKEIWTFLDIFVILCRHSEQMENFQFDRDVRGKHTAEIWTILRGVPCLGKNNVTRIYIFGATFPVSFCPDHEKTSKFFIRSLFVQSKNVVFPIRTRTE